MSPTRNVRDLGGFDPADGGTGHHVADLGCRGIRRAGADPASHVRVQREIDRAQKHLSRAGLRHGRLDKPEIGLGRLTPRARRQDDLMIHELDGLPFEIHGANPLMIIPPREARSANDSRKEW